MHIEALPQLKQKNRLRLAVLALALAGGAVALPASDALAQAMHTPTSSQFYPFLGYWKGDGQLSLPGKDPELLKLSLSCRKAVAGFAVRCDFVGRSDTMTFVEADLMAVDPATGVAHWYAVNNQGETHDHTAQWPDAATMNAHYDWAQNGRQMSENVIFRFRGGKHMSFRSVTTQDGQEVGAFFGNMYR